MMTTTQPDSKGRDLFTFDRWDRLGLQVMLGAIALVALVALGVGPIVDWVRGKALAVPFSSAISVPQLDGVGGRHGDGSYDVFVANATTGQRLLDLVPGLLTATLIVAAAYLVLRFIRDLAAGQTFAPQQVSRLRWIAGILVLGVPVVEFAQMACTGALLSSVDLGGLAPAVTFPVPWLTFIAGMCVALVAEAFKVGTRLRDDVDGLV